MLHPNPNGRFIEGTMPTMRQTNKNQQRGMSAAKLHGNLNPNEQSQEDLFNSCTRIRCSDLIDTLISGRRFDSRK